MRVRIGISTCPNDTFAFHGILSGEVRIDDLELHVELMEIQELNQRMRAGTLDVVKASFAAALHRARPEVPDRRDRALAHEIVTGTLRWLATIDHVIAHFARRPLAKLDPVVLDVLRLSAYQLGHLDRVPASAVVSDAAVGLRSSTALSAPTVPSSVTWPAPTNCSAASPPGP